MWLIWAMVCLLTAPWVQLSVSAGNGWPHSVHNWVVSFLIWRRQICAINGVCSPVLPISRGIIQESAVGPTFYIILKSDLNPLSANNVLSKYADDLNLR